jgi:hypothetical protein
MFGTERYSGISEPLEGLGGLINKFALPIKERTGCSWLMLSSYFTKLEYVLLHPQPLS